MVEEMKALQKKSTWEMVELPMGKKTIRCKWVCSVKYKFDRTINRYKARLVAEKNKKEELEKRIPCAFSLIHCEYIYTKDNLTFLIDYNSIRQVS